MAGRSRIANVEVAGLERLELRRHPLVGLLHALELLDRRAVFFRDRILDHERVEGGERRRHHPGVGKTEGEGDPRRVLEGVGDALGELPPGLVGEPPG